MLTSIATVCVSGTLDEKLHAIARAGFDAVELFEPDLLSYAGSPRDVAAMLSDLGLSCALYQPFRDFEGMPPALRQRALDRAARKFDLMGKLGCNRILVCSNCSPDATGDRARIVADLHDLGELAASRDIVVGYEALAWGRHVHDHRDAWDIVRTVDHPAVGIILDSFHSLARRIPTRSIADIDPAKIAFVQLADAPALDMDLLFWSRHYRCLPGQGDLAVAEYVAAILATGYTGPLSLEIFNDRFRASSTQLVANDGLRSLRGVIDQAERLLGRPTTTPAPVRVAEVEFLEIAASDAEAKALAPLLGALGFAHTGRHRSKQVDRWQQGTVSIVVNREQEGFAHAYAVTHGAAICAIGVAVADPDTAVQRARMLGVPVFEQDPGPGNLALTALRGVGGSLVYLMPTDDTDGIWTHEFGRLAVPPIDPILHRIDHVAASVDIDEFLSWQLYWTSLFAVAKQAELDIPDPAGLVQSRAIESSDGRFRVTMNASGGRGTLTSRFLSNVFGAGFQHVAFETDDIHASAERLSLAGVPMLPIPANYYADLAARFGLSDDEVRGLQSANILFDRDASGNSYWQIYTRAFQKRFFFEIVQRAGYAGYGAANAPIRLGAQARYRADAVD